MSFKKSRIISRDKFDVIILFKWSRALKRFKLPWQYPGCAWLQFCQYFCSLFAAGPCQNFQMTSNKSIYIGSCCFLPTFTKLFWRKWASFQKHCLCSMQEMHFLQLLRPLVFACLVTMKFQVCFRIIYKLVQDSV